MKITYTTAQVNSSRAISSNFLAGLKRSIYSEVALQLEKKNALRSLLIYAVIGVAGYAYFSSQYWPDQASATMGAYESVENYREAQNIGVASRDEYLEKKQAIADKLKKEQEKKGASLKSKKRKKNAWCG